jgi:general secretion pathway protein D
VHGQKGWKSQTARRGYAGSPAGTAGLGKLEREKEKDKEEEPVKSKTFIVADTAVVIQRIAAIVAQVDQKPIQVLIQGKLMEVNADRLRDMGLEFGTGATGAETPGVQAATFSQGGDVLGVGVQQVSGSFAPANFQPSASSLSGALPFNAGLSLVFRKLTDTQFEVMLHALEEELKANILSEPRILTLNNLEASITVGTKFPIITGTVGGGETRATTTSLDYYQDVGIQLNVVPQVCDNNYINMIVRPVVTDVIGTESGVTGGSDVTLTPYPVLSTREVETQILLKSGQTIVIGGLLKERESKSQVKVPILGDIPLLGRLFRRDTVDKSKVELLIFLTATIVDTPEDIQAKAEAVGAAR